MLGKKNYGQKIKGELYCQNCSFKENGYMSEIRI